MRLEGWGGHLISGLPEISILMRKSGKPDLRVRDAALRAAPHHEADQGNGLRRHFRVLEAGGIERTAH
jgi:hypothetical protein